MKKKRVHAIVHGRVQGVFFRDYTRKQAELLGLSGWVRNLPDRTVETVFEGDTDSVTSMLQWLKTGSPMSDVTDIDAREEDPQSESKGFEIRY